MKDFLLIIVIIMSACSSQQYSQNLIINSEEILVRNEAELFFFDENLSYEENKKISKLFSLVSKEGPTPLRDLKSFCPIFI